MRRTDQAAPLEAEPTEPAPAPTLVTPPEQDDDEDDDDEWSGPLAAW